MNRDEEAGDSLLSMAEQAQKAAGKAANPKIEEAWLKIAKRYRDLAAKQRSHV